MTRHQRIKDQLGMPHGTASNKLRKNILFKYVQKANENFCHVCGAEIESVDDLSIEHIQPWEGRDTELFWSLDNIAFSHIRCNRPHRYAGPTINTVPGMQRCHQCGETKPLSEYYPNRSGKRTHQSHCKECHKNWRNK